MIVKVFGMIGTMLLLLSSTSAIAGIILHGTRIIYNESRDNVGANITIKSEDNSNTPYLIRTQIYRDVQGQVAQDKFVTTPSMFRLEPNNLNQVKILRIKNDLPKDRESIFYFRAIALPATDQLDDKANPNLAGTLQIATGNTIKLFYRPVKFSISQKEAMGLLKFSLHSNGLKVANPTPYYITLSEIKVANKLVKLNPKLGNTMIAPFSDVVYQDIHQKGKVQWGAINDFGGRDQFNGSVQ
ncbi:MULTISPECIES: fimbrial biogenesis chaperone [Providencia]|uniref:fimbrial biogenesis chaperone n=1 Tax=Providencia TaxID=586 RepID=UPI0034DCF8E7